jgi:hypothetical protein
MDFQLWKYIQERYSVRKPLPTKFQKNFGFSDNLLYNNPGSGGGGTSAQLRFNIAP